MATSILAIFIAWTNGCSAMSTTKILHSWHSAKKPTNLLAVLLIFLLNVEIVLTSAYAVAEAVKDPRRIEIIAEHIKSFSALACRYFGYS